MPDQRRRLRPPDDAPRPRHDIVTNVELPWQLHHLADYSPPGQFVGEILAQAARRIEKLEREASTAKKRLAQANLQVRELGGDPDALADVPFGGEVPMALEVLPKVLDLVALDIPDLAKLREMTEVLPGWAALDHKDNDGAVRRTTGLEYANEVAKAIVIAERAQALNGALGLVPKDVATSAADIADPDATPEEVDAFLDAIAPAAENPFTTVLGLEESQVEFVVPTPPDVDSHTDEGPGVVS